MTNRLFTLVRYLGPIAASVKVVPRDTVSGYKDEDDIDERTFGAVGAGFLSEDSDLPQPQLASRHS